MKNAKLRRQQKKNARRSAYTKQLNLFKNTAKRKRGFFEFINPKKANSTPRRIKLLNENEENLCAIEDAREADATTLRLSVEKENEQIAANRARRYKKYNAQDDELV